MYIYNFIKILNKELFNVNFVYDFEYLFDFI